MAEVKAFRQLYVKERAKTVKILSTGNQFHGATPSQIQLKAVAEGIAVSKYEWFVDESETVRGTSQNFMVANNQVATVLVVKVVVTATNEVTYEDVISISKVNDGNQGMPGKLPVQREWKAGDVYRNNDSVIDYIYHRATNTWWRLKDGYNNVTAQVNPTIEFVQLSSLEQLNVNLLIAENANIGGLVLKDEKLISQSPSLSNPNIIIDGKNGNATFKNARIEGIINALGGSFGGFTIQENKIVSDNGVLEINALGFLGIKKPGAAHFAIRLGLDTSGEPAIQFFDNNGNEIWSNRQTGIVYYDRVPESYTRIGEFNRVSTNTNAIYNEAWNTTFLNGLRKRQDKYMETGVAGGQMRYVMDVMVMKTKSSNFQFYGYSAGQNEESAGNKQYESFIYTSQNKLGAKALEGWYVSVDEVKFTYSNGFAEWNESLEEIVYLPPKLQQEYSYSFFKVLNGKKVATGEITKKALLSIISPGATTTVAVPYTKM